MTHLWPHIQDQILSLTSQLLVFDGGVRSQEVRRSVSDGLAVLLRKPSSQSFQPHSVSAAAKTLGQGLDRPSSGKGRKRTHPESLANSDAEPQHQLGSNLAGSDILASHGHAKVSDFWGFWGAFVKYAGAGGSECIQRYGTKLCSKQGRRLLK